MRRIERKVRKSRKVQNLRLSRNRITELRGPKSRNRMTETGGHVLEIGLQKNEIRGL